MTARAEALLPLAAATDVAVAGAKAAALARAAADGFRVPDAAVIPVNVAHAMAAGNDPAGTEELVGLVNQLGGIVAVRSSASDEDGPRASFAGQYESVLGVSSDHDLMAAIVRCVRSADSQAVAGYRAHAQGNRPSMAVLIQRMLQPRAAGVAFSADPVTGDDQVVIEATTGVGDALLAGEITGERWLVDREPAVDGPSLAILSVSEAKEIAVLCRSLADRTGGPVDIEWAIEQGELWLLQARPITALPLEPTSQLPADQTFLREPRVQAPLRPLSFSSWLPIHGAVHAQLFEEFGLPIAGLDHRYHLGRIYSRTVPLIDRGKDGDDPPTIVLKLSLRLVPSMRRRVANARRWDGDRQIEALIDAWEQEGRESTAKRTRVLRERDLTTMSDVKIADHVDEVQRHVHDVALDHFRLSIGAMAIPMGRLGLFVEDRLGWTTTEAITLVQGYGRASVAQSQALGALAKTLGPAGVDAVIDDPASMLDHRAARHYLDRFGHIVHLELADPTEAEDPRLLADHLRRLRDHGANVTEDAADPRAQAEQAEERGRQALASAGDRAEFARLLALARRGRPLGDETEGTSLTALSLMRGIGLEVGRRWSEAGRIIEPADVWFLELDELRARLRSSSAPLPDIERRQRHFRWAQTHSAPDRFGPEPGPLPPPSVVGATYRSTLGAGLWAFATMEGAAIPQPDEERLVRGLPGSSGTATGTARILRDVADFAQVEPGDIVVCPVTTASWSPIFGVIGGLVTENGGPLSHPGTLAREYGLPAVLSVPDATTRIPEGARIRLDGASGEVEILA